MRRISGVTAAGLKAGDRLYLQVGGAVIAGELILVNHWPTELVAELYVLKDDGGTNVYTVPVLDSSFDIDRPAPGTYDVDSA